MHQRTVFIIGGGGMVGATAAQALAIKEVANEIVLIDVAHDLAQAQAMDINHATAYTNGVRVRAGDYDEIKENDIVVITCGAPQDPSRTHRMDLLEVNAQIVEEVVGKVMAQGKPVYIVMVTNPVDVMTYVALKTSGLPKSYVLGTGTMLDTARLRVQLANSLDISQQAVEAYVLGEHGNSSFAALSGARIGGVPLQSFPGFTPQLVANINQDIHDAAYKIIAVKKATYYGIGNTVARAVEALMQNKPSVLPVCSLAEGEYGLEDIIIGMPSLVSTQGVTMLDHYPLSPEESKQLLHTAKVLQQALAQVA